MTSEPSPQSLTPRNLIGEITAYLALGGLCNPEMMNHDAVRDLLLDCRSELTQLRAEVERLKEGWRMEMERGFEHVAIIASLEAERDSLKVENEQLRARSRCLMEERINKTRP